MRKFGLGPGCGDAEIGARVAIEHDGVGLAKLGQMLGDFR